MNTDNAGQYLSIATIPNYYGFAFLWLLFVRVMPDTT